jgi:ElaA protein
MQNFKWVWKKFSELTNLELYEIIKVRETVFVVEQKLSYVDCDDFDQAAYHLMGYIDEKLCAYLRAFPPGTKHPESSFGRVLTIKAARGIGMGRELTRQGLQHIEENFGKVSVVISAQAQLENFYSGFGFIKMSELYMEEGIPHLKMLKQIHRASFKS